MPSKSKFKTDFAILNKLRKLQQIRDTPVVEVKASAHGRSEKRNIIAIRDNAKRGRKFAYVSAPEQRKIQSLVSPEIAKTLRTNSLASKSVGDKVGRMLVQTLQDHISQGKLRGKQQPLNPEYRKRKRGTLLFETGNLLRSLHYKVSRIKISELGAFGKFVK